MSSPLSPEQHARVQALAAEMVAVARCSAAGAPLTAAGSYAVDLDDLLPPSRRAYEGLALWYLREVSPAFPPVRP